MKPMYKRAFEWLRDFLIRHWPSFRDAYWAHIAEQARGKTSFTQRELLASAFTYGVGSITYQYIPEE